MRQGDALSCAFFTIFIDPLLRNMNKVPTIKNIDIKLPITNEEVVQGRFFHQYYNLSGYLSPPSITGLYYLCIENSISDLNVRQQTSQDLTRS